MKLRIKTLLTAIWVLVLLPTVAFASFSDTETSKINTFTASTLNATITNIQPSTSLPLNSVLTFKLTNTGELTTHNTQTVKNISNTALGAKVKVSVLKNNVPYVPYTNIPLTSFSMTDFLTQDSGQDTNIAYIFTFSDYLHIGQLGRTVTFTIENYAYQDGVTYGEGFYSVNDLNVKLSFLGLGLFDTVQLAPESFTNPATTLLNSADPQF